MILDDASDILLSRKRIWSSIFTVAFLPPVLGFYSHTYTEGNGLSISNLL